MARRQQNAFLVGRVAVRVIIVDGPPGSDAAFTPRDIARIGAINQRALTILSRLAAAQPPRIPLVWAPNTSVVPVPVPPFPPAVVTSLDPVQVEAREAPWRDAALTTLVGQSGAAGLAALRAASIGGADHCIIIFWTRYECSHPAYATDALARLVMCHPMIARERLGQGLQDAPRHLAHEICHLFGAVDEYIGPGSCDVLNTKPTQGGPVGFGELDFPNFNCARTNPAPVACLMLDSIELICPSTVAHIGWADSNGDGVLDVFQ